MPLRKQATRIASAPRTPTDLHQWIRRTVPLSTAQSRALRQAIEATFTHQERQWQAAARDAIQAMSDGFNGRIQQMHEELSARESTVASLTRHFEQLVADLTDRVHRDPKTRLINFRRFIDELEAYLALEQRGQWCAIGLIDINSFKSINDRFGHTTGDRIIERIARLLREQIRADDLVAQDPQETGLGRELHARFGGDEFCFLIPGLEQCTDAWVIAERFRHAVDRVDWSADDARLAGVSVAVDVGVVGLFLGSIDERRGTARQLAEELLARADGAMYAAKGSKAGVVQCVPVRVRSGQLVDLRPDDQTSAQDPALPHAGSSAWR